MNYERLIAEHSAIEAAMTQILVHSQRIDRTSEAISTELERLAILIKDHVAAEGDVIYRTVVRTRGGRHAEIAERAAAELDRLNDDRIGYLYRWDSTAIADNWADFCAETADMTARIQARVTYDTMILYSLALHHGVIEV